MKDIWALITVQKLSKNANTDINQLQSVNQLTHKKNSLEEINFLHSIWAENSKGHLAEARGESPWGSQTWPFVVLCLSIDI